MIIFKNDNNRGIMTEGNNFPAFENIKIEDNEANEKKGKSMLPSALSGKRLCKNIKGLTLVEVMVAMLLGLIVTTVVFIYNNAISSSGKAQRDIAIIQNEIIAATEIMERDIMNTGCNPKENSNFSTYRALYYTYSGPGSMRLQMDMDNDGTYSGDSGELVIYRYNSTTKILERLYYTGSAWAATQPILKNVTAFNLKYWNSNTKQFICSNEVGCEAFGSTTAYGSYSTATLTSSQATYVNAVIYQITLRSANKDPDTGEYITRSIEKWVDMRNR